MISSTGTQISASGLDISAQKTVVERKIHSTLLRAITQILERTQQQVRQEIQNHKLYVMFESQLGCNPQNDHLFPKDVLPLYDAQIARVFQRADQATILCLQKYIFEGISAFEIADLSKDVEQNEITINNLQVQNKQLLTLLTQTHEKYQKEQTRLRNYLLKLKEQLFQVVNLGDAYAPDIGLFDANFLGQQPESAADDVTNFGLDRKSKLIQMLQTKLHGLQETLQVTTDSIQRNAQLENKQLQEQLRLLSEERSAEHQQLESLSQQQLEVIEELKRQNQRLSEEAQKARDLGEKDRSDTVALQDAVKHLQEEIEQRELRHKAELDEKDAEMSRRLSQMHRQLAKMRKSTEPSSPHGELSQATTTQQTSDGQEGVESVQRKKIQHDFVSLKKLPKRDKTRTKRAKNDNSSGTFSESNFSQRYDTASRGGACGPGGKGAALLDGLQLLLRDSAMIGASLQRLKMQLSAVARCDIEDVARKIGSCVGQQSAKAEKRLPCSTVSMSDSTDGCDAGLRKGIVSRTQEREKQSDSGIIGRDTIGGASLVEEKPKASAGYQSSTHGSVQGTVQSNVYNDVRDSATGNLVTQSQSGGITELPGNVHRQSKSVISEHTASKNISETQDQVQNVSCRGNVSAKQYVDETAPLRGNSSVLDDEPHASEPHKAHTDAYSCVNNTTEHQNSRIATTTVVPIGPSPTTATGAAIPPEVTVDQTERAVHVAGPQVTGTAKAQRVTEHATAAVGLENDVSCTRDGANSEKERKVDQDTGTKIIPQEKQDQQRDGHQLTTSQLDWPHDAAKAAVKLPDLGSQAANTEIDEDVQRLMAALGRVGAPTQAVGAVLQHQEVQADVRALQTIGELQEALRRLLGRRDFAVQVCPGRRDPGEHADPDPQATERLAAHVVDLQLDIKAHARSGPAARRRHAAMVTEYRNAPGSNVFERLYSYSKIIQARLCERRERMRAVGSRASGFGADLGGSEVFARNFYYELGRGLRTAEPQTSRLRGSRASVQTATLAGVRGSRR